MRVFRMMMLAGAGLAPVLAGAQVSVGVGAGSGLGSRGGPAVGDHAMVSLAVNLPIAVGLRADAYYLPSSERPGRLSAAVAAFTELPVPVVIPYALVGWGRYGIDDRRYSLTGWHAGAGMRLSAGFTMSPFVEVTRHSRYARDLWTLGVRF